MIQVINIFTDRLYFYKYARDRSGYLFIYACGIGVNGGDNI